ncbi:MAG: response regulator transcription factor [Fimbriimonadales bacterium]
MQKILVVDDEKSIAEAVMFALRREGFHALTAATADECMRLFRNEKPDLIILDVMLPAGSGFEICRTIRQESDVPIIMLTARAGEVDRVAGLEMGADDYVTKPFSLREVAARVKAVLRRKQEVRNRSERIEVAGLTIDPSKHTLEVRGQMIELTRREFTLLLMLATNPDQVFGRDVLLDRVWGANAYVEARTVDVHIRWLREKIEVDPSKPRILLTVRGVGYKLSSAGNAN